MQKQTAHIRANVSCGSKAALTGPKRRFRFAPINGHRSTGSAGPFRAIKATWLIGPRFIGPL
jgi:hypothetical protein